MRNGSAKSDVALGEMIDVLAACVIEILIQKL